MRYDRTYTVRSYSGGTLRTALKMTGYLVYAVRFVPFTYVRTGMVLSYRVWTCQYDRTSTVRSYSNGTLRTPLDNYIFYGGFSWFVYAVRFVP